MAIRSLLIGLLRYLLRRFVILAAALLQRHHRRARILELVQQACVLWISGRPTTAGAPLLSINVTGAATVALLARQNYRGLPRFRNVGALSHRCHLLRLLLLLLNKVLQRQALDLGRA